MFFNRVRHQAAISPRTGLTDGIEDKIATFVKEWGAFKRSGRDYTPDGSEAVLKLLTDADTAYFVKAMEDETAAIEAEISDQVAEIKRKNLAAIAQKDAQIAAINREIEAAKAKIAAQDAEVIRRGDRLFELRNVAKAIVPALVTDSLTERSIVREVVRLKMGDAAVVGLTDDQFDARFDILAANLPAHQDPFQRVMKDYQPVMDAKQKADHAYLDYVQSLRDAHKETKH